ncbi:MAG TPA: enoyl-CoA hydratase/isomerase family protein [Candidatus Gastranaerophilales bacterium]|nr:enoyl-CoA hydratase/isomerase family protein [Candidatus Gastranaerophilales bacterium]
MNHINLIKTDFLAKIILSKPPLNILEAHDLEKLAEILDSIKKENTLRAVIIESDQKIFSAGVNISSHAKEKINEMLKAFHSVFFKLLDLEIPVISLVKSGCIGGGCELALFCDFVLASEKAYFSQPEIKIGCYPPVSLVYFPYLTGNKKSLEMILTGNKLSAKDALLCGFINHVFNDEEFDTKAELFINSVIGNSQAVIKTALKAYKRLHYAEIKDKLKFSEKIYLEELMRLEDTEEGLKSFLEKRQPVWKGR